MNDDAPINLPEPETTVCIACDVDMSVADNPSGKCGVCEGRK